ncbi:MAG: cell division protein FtsQ/DivIB [Nevskiaceae bacterium]|jgi:cell division protein FtsQ|nr:cell division protein FtsQ/DivIB [Nevskiaceae bacterium]
MKLKRNKRAKPQASAAKRRLKLPSINWGRWLSAMAMCAALVAGGFALKLALNRPLDRIAVEGRFQRVSPLDIEKAVRGAVGDAGVFSVNLETVSRAVRQIPWVDGVRIARGWPNELIVRVEEQRPVARWGETGLVNVRGELFVNDARHIPVELPELVGPAGAEAAMTQWLLETQGRLVEADLRMSQLKLDERGAWEMSLANGVVVRLGRLQAQQRFDRFMDVAARIVASRAADIAYVDLRYANGFAIGWRTASTEASRG